MIAKLRNYFITGVVVILPAALTVLILRYFFIKINSLLLDPILRLLGPYVPGAGMIYFKYLIKALILVAVVGGVVLIGMATRNILVKRSISFGERLLYRIPFVSKVYTAVREVTHAFLARDRRLFRRVALVEYPRKGVYSLGFVTSEGRGEVQAKTNQHVLNVFIPTTPNPTSGVLLMVPQQDVIDLDMSVEEGIKLVISGGGVTPPYEKKFDERTE